MQHVVDYPYSTAGTNNAVLLRLSPGKTGRVDTQGLIGYGAVAGFLVGSRGKTLLGLSHYSLVPDKAASKDNPHCLSAQFMQLLSRSSFAFGKLLVAKIVPLTMVMEPGVSYPNYDNRPILQDIQAAKSDIESLGMIEIIPETYRRSPNSGVGHNLDVVRTHDSVSISLRSGGAYVREPLFELVAPINQAGQQ